MCKWEDNIKLVLNLRSCETVGWIKLITDSQLTGSVTKLMILLDPCKAAVFLISRLTISLCRKSLLHGAM